MRSTCPLPYSYRKNRPIPASLRLFDAEDRIVEICVGHPQGLALACEIAAEAIRQYDAELPSIPNNACLFIVTERDRAELRRLLAQQPRSLGLTEQATQIIGELSRKVTCDELFLAAFKALNYVAFRAGHG
jgi:hypothetical protein